MINIIGGIKKGTKIHVPDILVRPTSSHKRESIFSIIKSYELKKNISVFKNKYVLDLFSGSGSLGLEAVSRGALFSYFYENNSEVINKLNRNCLNVCCIDKFRIINEDILESEFINLSNKISLVFIDPPYSMNPFEKILLKISEKEKLSNKALIIIECKKNLKFNIPSNFNLVSERFYGKTRILFLSA